MLDSPRVRAAGPFCRADSHVMYVWRAHVRSPGAGRATRGDFACVSLTWDNVLVQVDPVMVISCLIFQPSIYLLFSLF